jgi:hypothetical protein
MAIVLIILITARIVTIVIKRIIFKNIKKMESQNTVMITISIKSEHGLNSLPKPARLSGHAARGERTC